MPVYHSSHYPAIFDTANLSILNIHKKYSKLLLLSRHQGRNLQGVSLQDKVSI